MRLIDGDLFMQRIEPYNTSDEKDKALYNFALHEIVCMPTVDVLDKIRDEIVEEQSCWREDTDAEWHECRRILRIIDKYRGDKNEI